MTTAAEITRRLDHDGHVVLPQRIGGEELAAAREEIAVLLASADWGSGFDGFRTRRVWPCWPGPGAWTGPRWTLSYWTR
jgi:hypothetical protein